MKFQSTLLSGALALCAIAGCRDRDLYGDDGPDPIDQGPTIYDLQSEEMPVGTQVDLEGVVVVTVDAYGGRTGGIYVMEPEGGPYSGVFVFLNDDEVAGDLRPGDLVDIKGGIKDEFALSSDESGRTLTELSPPDGGGISVTKVGDSRVPDPVVLLPQDLAASDDEAEKWEGVLIKFEDIRLLNAPRSATNSDDTLFEFRITGPFIVQSSLAAFPEGMKRDDCTRSITGIGDYFFDYKLLPRSTADVELGGDDCLPVEVTDELCADGEDNDFNGFSDCDDLGCLAAKVACPSSAATVVDIQTGMISEETRVALAGVVVTGIDQNMTNATVFVQDAGGAGQNNGIAVFTTNPLPAGMVVGSVVDLEGTVDEFDDQVTELVQPTWGTISGSATPSVLTGMNPTTLADLDMGEPFEGVVVTLTNVRVVSPDAGNGKATIGVMTTPLFVDDDFDPTNLLPMLTANQCIGSITGVMHWNSGDNHRSLLPRTLADVVLAGGTCP